MHELATVLIERLHELGVETKYEVGNEEQSIIDDYEAQTMNELEYYKRIIQNYQRLNFGKTILDRLGEKVATFDRKGYVIEVLGKYNLSLGHSKNLATNPIPVLKENCETLTDEEFNKLEELG